MFTIVPVSIVLGLTLHIYMMFNFGAIKEEKPLHRLFTLTDLNILLEKTRFVEYFIYYVGAFILSTFMFASYKDIDKLAKKMRLTLFLSVLFSIASLYFIAIFFLGTVNVFHLNKATAKLGETPAAILKNYNIVNSYGLFRRMTGIEGRDELLIYGSDDGEDWKLYEMYYKPTKKSYPPAFAAPHQPRLDWQLWFSALSHSQSSRDIYLHSLALRLLSNSKSVLELFSSNPFPDSPPQYIKISKLRYHFSDYSELKSGKYVPENWWKIDSKRLVYLPKMQLPNFGNLEGLPVNYPLHPMQSIKLVLCYLSIALTKLVLNILGGLFRKPKPEEIEGAPEVNIIE